MGIFSIHHKIETTENTADPWVEVSFKISINEFNSAIGAMHFGEIELGLRDAQMKIGGEMLSALIANVPETAPLCDKCGGKMRNLGKRGKKFVSIIGEGTATRNYYKCLECGSHSLPKDDLIGIKGVSFTPQTRRHAAMLAACAPFRASSIALKELCGVKASPSSVRRIANAAGEAERAQQEDQIKQLFEDGSLPQSIEIDWAGSTAYLLFDGVSVPVVKKESEGRKGRGEDGSSKTREAKLGAIFSSSSFDEEGKPIRDEGSTFYFGAIETSEEFGKRVLMEAMPLGINGADRMAVIADGARWIWGLTSLYFPDAVQIIDICHAKENLCKHIKTINTDAAGMAQAKKNCINANKYFLFESEAKPCFYFIFTI